jgi:hypothetical protein
MEDALLPQPTAIQQALVTRTTFYYYFHLIPIDTTELDSIPL